MSISLPMAVVHTANFAADNFMWAENSGEKRGLLGKQCVLVKFLFNV